MTEQQINKLAMGSTTYNVCQKNVTVLSSIPVLNTKYQAFGTILTEIKATRLLQDKDTKGITQDKAVTENSMIQGAVHLGSAVAVYARDNNNNDLLSSVKVTYSALRNMRDMDCLSTCKSILNSGKNHIAALNDYGITQEKLDELEHYISEYEAVVTAPRETTSDKSAATKKLEELFNQMDSALIDMDGLVKQFELTAPDFYNSYKTARKIVDLG